MIVPADPSRGPVPVAGSVTPTTGVFVGGTTVAAATVLTGVGVRVRVGGGGGGGGVCVVGVLVLVGVFVGVFVGVLVLVGVFVGVFVGVGVANVNTAVCVAPQHVAATVASFLLGSVQSTAPSCLSPFAWRFARSGNVSLPVTT